MKAHFNVLLILVLVASTFSVGAAPGKRTRLLHDVYCKACHGSTIYLTEDRKLRTRDQIKAQVFSYQGKYPLSKQELADIAEYLWLDYYQDRWRVE